MLTQGPHRSELKRASPVGPVPSTPRPAREKVNKTSTSSKISARHFGPVRDPARLVIGGGLIPTVLSSLGAQRRYRVAMHVGIPRPAPGGPQIRRVKPARHAWRQPPAAPARTDVRRFRRDRRDRSASPLAASGAPAKSCDDTDRGAHGMRQQFGSAGDGRQSARQIPTPPRTARRCRTSRITLTPTVGGSGTTV